jgi:hypothetical protein
MPQRLACLALICLAHALVAAPKVVTLDAKLHHLGDSTVKEWVDLTDVEPAGHVLTVNFEAKANATEQVLSFRLRDADTPWVVRLNDKTLVTMGKQKKMRRFHLVLPPKRLIDGANVLTFQPKKKKNTDDVIVGDFKLHLGTMSDVMQHGSLTVEVNDATGRPLPARVTIVAKDGSKPALLKKDPRIAFREGLAYVMGKGTVTLPAGDYRVYVSRGFEWSIVDKPATVIYKGNTSVAATLQQEVDTTGWIASDTHIHTLTHSGHGDSSVEERIITLAGEGVELAIATDHNHNTDYAPTQKALEMTEWYTPVVGNEVTTPLGHFNAFPLRAGDPIPGHRGFDWIKLVDGMRTAGAKVVILNHPRWPSIQKGPFGHFGLDRKTGKRAKGPEFTFDAVEIVNSTTVLEDPHYLLFDWFALLNHGDLITGVGSSDSHTVGDPVGQGRTYLPSKTDDPAKVDVDASCEAFLRGHCSVSMGIMATATVNGAPMGAVVAAGDSPQLKLRVAAPSWVKANTVFVYVNGEEVLKQELADTGGKPLDVTIDHKLAKPAKDSWVACAVIGDGITNPAWPTMVPYTIAVTNPVYLDVDGDKSYKGLKK